MGLLFNSGRALQSRMMRFYFTLEAELSDAGTLRVRMLSCAALMSWPVLNSGLRLMLCDRGPTSVWIRYPQKTPTIAAHQPAHSAHCFSA